MTTETRTIPKWLNPEVMPPAELIDWIPAASEALRAIEESIEGFNATYKNAILAYQDVTTGHGFPDDIYFEIDRLTGFRDLWDRLSNIGSETLAYIDEPPKTEDVLANLSDDEQWNDLRAVLEQQIASREGGF